MTDINFKPEIKRADGCGMAEKVEGLPDTEMKNQLQNIATQSQQLFQEEFDQRSKSRSFLDVPGSASDLIGKWTDEFLRKDRLRTVEEKSSQDYKSIATYSVLTPGGQILFSNVYDQKTGSKISGFCRSTNVE